ncbi:MAG TPA: DUF3997 domain-containing protein [Candidatus Kapabacteria bacterium]|nr:DUF3997 domain-containing protein [Candidatus Kapabacteria bacterium]
MKTIKFIQFLIIILFLFSSCQDIAYNEKIIGRYYLIAIDYLEQMNLSFQLENNNSVGIIGQTVFAVGFNKNYIIVKQHPYNNRKITNYYIVLMHHEMTYWSEKGVLGPYNLEEFEQKRQELNISDIKFTVVKESLK